MDNVIILLIESIRKNPVLYIGNNSITRLAFYIYGYESAIMEIVDSNHKRNLMRSFQKFVSERHSIGETIGWYTILLNITQDQENALLLFWKLWDEFLVLHSRDNICEADGRGK